MKTTALHLVFTCLLLPSFFLLQRPADVKGWSTTTWGMTEQQVIEMFKGKAVKVKEPEERKEGFFLKIKDWEIGRQNYEVSFRFEPRKRTLTAVTLVPFEKNHDTLVDIAQDLEQQLVRKYGQASHRKSKPRDENLTLDWNFSSTIIELTLISGRPTLDFVTLFLSYTINGKSDLDKL